MTARILFLTALLSACATTAEREPELRPVYPPPPDPPRVQFLTSFSGSGDVESGATALDQFLFGANSEVERPIQRPVGVAVWDGVAYALDAQLMLVHRVDIASKELQEIALEGRAQLRVPTDLHMSREGLVYVADRGRRQVLVFDRDWRLVRELGPWGESSAPVAVAAWRDRVFVADTDARCVRVVNGETGEQIGQLKSDPEDRQTAIRTPTGVAVDDNGWVYVVDAIYQRVLVFDDNYEFVRQIGEPGYEPGCFGRPKAVTVVDNTVWVLDSLFENCQILDLNGRPLMFFGGGGVGPGNLYLPRGIWVGTDGMELFRDMLEPGFVMEKLVAVTSFYGPRKLSFYALGRSERPGFQDKYAAQVLPERPARQSRSEPDDGK